MKAFSQCELIGHYRDHFGSQLQLNLDSTFKYTWYFDLASSWTIGKWRVKGDTLYFKMTPIYDTFELRSPNGKIYDTLMLSSDNIKERLSPEQAIATMLSSGGQNQNPYPEKLLFMAGRLYKISNGQLLTEKQRGLWSWKKYDPWFFKSDEIPTHNKVLPKAVLTE